MIKLFIATIALLLAFIVTLFYKDVRTKSHDLYKNEIAWLTIVTVLLDILYAFSYLSPNLETYRLLTYLCFAINLILVYLLVDFFTKYVKCKVYSEIRYIVLILIMADILVILSNIVSPWCLDFISVTFLDEVFYLLIRNKALFYSQLIPILLGSFVLICLGKRIASERGIFKLKYLYLEIMIGIAVFLNILLPILEFAPINFVYMVNSVLTIETMYVVMYHAPKTLRQKIQSSLMSDSTDAYIAFDVDGNFFYCNDAAKQVVTEEELERGYDYICSILHELPKNGESFNYELNIDGKIYYYKITHATLVDSKDRVQAYYFTLHDITKESLELIEKEFIITHDNLTKCYNRERFFIEANKKIENSNDTWYLIVTNFENFRLYNELYGTKAGDDLLIAMRDFMGTLDHQIPYCYARMGSDMFAAIMRKSEYEAFDYGNQAIEYFKPYESQHVILRLAVCEVAYHTIPEAFERANQTIHYYHNSMTNRVAFFNNGINEAFLRESEIVAKFEEGLKNQEFVVYYQPQVDSRSGLVSGAEALVRWNNVDLGFVSPGEFIPIFEQKGLVTKLDLYVFETVFKLLKYFDGLGKNVPISINISRLDFYHIDVAKTILDLCDKYNVSKKAIKLEVTESAFTSDQDVILKEVSRLKELGFVIEIDDFGSGYSSLNVLKDIPLDVMKLDMKFMEDSYKNDKAKVIIKQMIMLANELDLPVIAEGVETYEQVKMLLLYGCYIIQGFYYSKPLPLEEFLAYIEKRGIKDTLLEKQARKEVIDDLRVNIDKYYRYLPCPTLVLKPIYDAKDDVYDMMIIYENQAFIDTLEKAFGKVMGKCVTDFLDTMDTNRINVIKEVISSKKSHVYPFVKIENKVYEISLNPIEGTENIMMVFK